MLPLTEAWAGRRGRAIERYRDAVRVLEDQLSVAPLAETTQLYEAIRKGHVPDPPRVEERSSDEDRSPVDGAAPAHRSPAPPPIPLVSRSKELALLADHYRRAEQGGRVTFIEGEGGIGKTRLVEEMVARVAAEGGSVALARCHDGESELPYASVIPLLRSLVSEHGGVEGLSAPLRTAIGALLPEGAPPGDATMPAGRGPEGRARFFESLLRAIAAMCDRESPTLLVVDDLHFADRSTVDFVAYLARRIADLRVCSWSRGTVRRFSRAENYARSPTASRDLPRQKW